MGGPARLLHEPGNHRSSERCSHRHSADCGSLIERPTLLRITAPTPRPGARSQEVPRRQTEQRGTETCAKSPRPSFIAERTQFVALHCLLLPFLLVFCKWCTCLTVAIILRRSVTSRIRANLGTLRLRDCLNRLAKHIAAAGDG